MMSIRDDIAAIIGECGRADCHSLREADRILDMLRAAIDRSIGRLGDELFGTTPLRERTEIDKE